MGRRAMSHKEALQEIKEYTGDRDEVLKHGSIAQIAERPTEEKVIHTSTRWGYKFEETESAIYVTKHTGYSFPFEGVGEFPFGGGMAFNGEKGDE
jgi:hypothetical protein